MTNKKLGLSIANTLLVTAALQGLTPVAADSLKVFNPVTGHYYQRFDLANVKQSTANANCNALKAHLVTFAGTDYGVDNKEADFVYSQLVSKSLSGAGNGYNFNFIGAVYNENTFTWSWVTGEPFGKNFPTTVNGYDYYGMKVSDSKWILSNIDGHIGSGIYSSTGYVCEWDGNDYIASATVPDLNNNGVDETAALYLDYKTNNHTVIIRDPKTHTTISTLTFANSTPTPPIGLAVIADMNINGVPEIAVLSGLTIRIKDAKNNNVSLKTFNFLNSTYQPRSLSATYSSDKTFSELTVVGVLPTGKATAETRDSKSGALLYSDTF